MQRLERLKIEALLKKGLKPREIKKQIHTHGCIITHLRKKLGMPPFRRGMPPGTKRRRGAEDKRFDQKSRKEAMELKVLGFTYKEIGKRLKVSRQRAQQYLRIPKNELAKHLTCENCGVGNKKLHAHHTDYTSNTFKALCVSCHRKQHAA